MAQPRYATGRNPDRPTYGAAVDAKAAELGAPLFPHQRMIADVAGEYDPATGRPTYPTVVIVMPRRAGKTFLVLAALLERLWRGPEVRGFYTAQTGDDGGKVVRDEWAPIIDNAPPGPGGVRPRDVIGFRYGRGDVGFYLTVAGKRYSRVEVFTPNANALHGRDADLVVVDEVWAFDELKGADIDAGIGPARWARPTSQLWYVSAGGHEGSGWLHRKMDLGRAGTEGIAYFEWSADGQAAGYDPYDEALWVATHPGIGHTVNLDTVRADALTMPRRDFERAMLCVWDRAAGTSLLAGWETLLHRRAKPAGPLTLAYDVNPERDAGAIAIAGDRTVEIVAHEPGTAWIEARVAELVARHDIANVYRDPSGPAGSTRLDGFTVTDVTVAQVAEACAALVDAIAGRELRIRPHPALAKAFAAANVVNRGDGRFIWARRTTAADLSPLYAATLAAWGDQTSVPGAIY